MRTTKFFLPLLLTGFLFSLTVTALTPNQQNVYSVPDSVRLDWWREARFGMFIHWGPVSQKGTEIGWSRGEEVPVDVYDNLYRTFDPVNFNAAEWVSVAQNAGMKYLILTAKHHDGFCLWDSKTTDYDIMSTPFQRDVVDELFRACRKQGIVFCTYYSILDWYHPDYNIDSRGGPGFELPPGMRPNMERYVAYMKQHLEELITRYGPLGVMWFDGEWEDRWTHERGVDLYHYVRGLQEDILINNRVDKGRKGMEGTTATDKNYMGDFDTPEQRVGGYQTGRPWETCITICEQWAWKPNDKLKSLKECIHVLVNTAGGDGNLLLNVGPMPDGRIEPRQVERLQQIGAWMQKYGQTIYATRGGPIKPAEWGVSTFTDNKIYLHILNWPGDSLRLDPFPAPVADSRVLTGGRVSITQENEDLLVDLSSCRQDTLDTIVEITLE